MMTLTAILDENSVRKESAPADFLPGRILQLPADLAYGCEMRNIVQLGFTAP